LRTIPGIGEEAGEVGLVEAGDGGEVEAGEGAR